MFEGLYLLESWELGCACFPDGRERLVDLFKGLYLLESWELGCACFPDGRERLVDYLGTYLVQV
jgi:hypothetical protein